METKDLITDFIELVEHERTEGRYEFYPHERDYLKEIPDYCYYKIVRSATEFHRGVVSIIFRDKKVTEIFSINKVNVPTYVSRRHDDSQTYEAALELALQDPGQSVVLYGPSKLGKSALWKSILNDESILIQCNHNLSISDIYKSIVDYLEKPQLSQYVQSDEETSTSGLGSKLSFGSDNTAKVEIDASNEKSTSQKVEKTHSFHDKTINAQYITNLLKSENYPIIFENYHRLNNETLKNLSVDLRTLSDENITTIFVGIPSNPYELTELNNELLGRIIFMEFDYWNEKELRKIAKGGENVLNIEFDESTLEFLCKESVGSPLLMQLFCLIACLASEVTYKQETNTEVSITKNQFKNAMKHFGSMYLAPCLKTWENFTKIVISLNLPTDFITNILNFIKSDNFSLSFILNDVQKNINQDSID